MKTAEEVSMPNVKRIFPGGHVVRYGTPADQKFLLGEFLSTYDQLVINGTIVAHAPAALSSFITQRTRNKSFMIDPQTHAFQHDLSNLESSSEKKQGELKRSIRTLIDKYGEPVRSCVGKHRTPVLPEDFKTGKTLSEFCGNVLRFQAETISNEVTKSDASKYFKYKEVKGGKERQDFKPNLLIAPYFYLTPKTLDDWLRVNLDCAKASRLHASKANIPLGIQIVISKDLLSSKDLIKKTSDAYLQFEKADAFLLWVDSFSEQNASEEDLRSLVGLIQTLSTKAPVINLYGGFFSVALMRINGVKNFCGVTHGLEYGEDRGVVPVGGGIPTAKYYLPALHMRLPFRYALRAVRALGGLRSASDFHNKVCDCAECKKVIVKNAEVEFGQFGKTRPVSFVRRDQPIALEYPLPETKEKSVRHYMWTKHTEYKASIPAVVEELSRVGKSLRRELGLEHTAHCNIWAKLLSEFIP